MEQLLDFLGKERRRSKQREDDEAPASPEKSLRIASVDIGGGTTDLMVTTYFHVDNRALIPEQNFREGFRRAGDDLLKLVVERGVVPAIQNHLESLGIPNARDILRDLFSDDSPRMSEADKHLRRQFVLRLMRPVALGILAAAEDRSPQGRNSAARAFSDFFPAQPHIFDRDSRILQYLENQIARLGAAEFSLADVPVPIDLGVVEACVFAAFDGVFSNIADAVYKLDADIVLLTGRPSCLPSVVDLFLNKHAVPVDHVIAVKDYRVGNWYPFRQPAQSLIDDPKTTAVVGGMLCTLASGQLTNFSLYTEGLTMRSTAKFIGEMRQDGLITQDKVYFSDVDLDDDDPPPMEREILFHTTIRIGYRQLAREDWVAAPLYRLRMARGTQNKISRPVSVVIERKSLDVDEDASNLAIMNSEATSEEFKITQAEDQSGQQLTKLMELKFDTSPIGSDGLYWLDSGILTVA